MRLVLTWLMSMICINNSLSKWVAMTLISVICSSYCIKMCFVTQFLWWRFWNGAFDLQSWQFFIRMSEKLSKFKKHFVASLNLIWFKLFNLRGRGADLGWSLPLAFISDKVYLKGKMNKFNISVFCEVHICQGIFRSSFCVILVSWERRMQLTAQTWYPLFCFLPIAWNIKKYL